MKNGASLCSLAENSLVLMMFSMTTFMRCVCIRLLFNSRKCFQVYAHVHLTVLDILIANPANT